MAEPQQEASRDWTWTKTPSRNERIFTIFVETQLMTLEDMPTTEIPALGGNPYVPATKFSELPARFLSPNLNSQGVQDWLFIGSDEGNPRTAFHFFPNKTPAELAIPYDSDTVTGNHYWPMVLLDVFDVVDDSVMVSSNVVEKGAQGIRTTPHVSIGETVINSVKEGSQITTEKYLSATKPAPRFDPAPQPQPVTVRTAGGVTKTYEEVLHDDLRFTPTTIGTVEILSNGNTRDIASSIGEQFFPRTGAFIDWKPFVLSRTPILTEQGLWETTVVKVRPPKRQPSTN